VDKEGLRLSKLEVAVSHIHSAIELRAQPGREASILHLAAAADEIIESMLKREGKPTLSQTLFNLFKEHLPDIDRKSFHQQLSFNKNAVKHADVPAEDLIEMPFGQAFLALARAVMNYEALTGQKTEPMQGFLKAGKRSSKTNEP